MAASVINRTIYTQGSVKILCESNPIANATVSMMTGGLVLSGVQSATYTRNAPKLDVGSFGVLGNINKVQVAPTTATMEVNLIVNSGNYTTDNGWLAALTNDAVQPKPTGITVYAPGVGELSGAILTAVRLEATIGALPTLAMTFDGRPGRAAAAGGVLPTTNNVTVIPVVTPFTFGSIYWLNNLSAVGCPQTVRFAWEMPVERLNCLMGDVDLPTIFTRPPGTMSIVAEGVDRSMIDSGLYITGLTIGPYSVFQGSGALRDVTRTANLAVGEAAGTYNITAEGVALGCSFVG
jgi:hypothetical protein